MLSNASNARLPLSGYRTESSNSVGFLRLLGHHTGHSSALLLVLIQGHVGYCLQLALRYSRVNYVWETSHYTTAASTTGRLVFVKKTGHINLALRTALSWTTEWSPPRPFLGPRRPTARDSPPPTGFRTKARPPDALFLFRPPCLCSFCILTWKETFPKCVFLLCTTQT